MISDKTVREIIKDYDTPLFVFDEAELMSRALSVKSILGPDIKLTFSVKANAFLVSALKSTVDYFEICSPGEFFLCKNVGVPPEKMLYSGVHKDLWDIREAVSYGAAVITAESKQHFENICRAAAETGRKPDVILRLTSGNQFGMSREDIEDILAGDSSNVNITGIHYFVGTGRSKLKKQREELKMLDGLISGLKGRYAHELSFFEYGPGLPVPYFIDEDFSDTLAPLKELSDVLHDLSGKYTLSVEMGRFLAASCGYYATSVCDIKTSKGIKWCIVDGGINHVNYLGQMLGMKIPVIRHYSKDERIDDSGGESTTVCGSLCTINDVLIRSLPLKDPCVNDVLVFENIGAYSVTEAPALFLSRPLPKVVMLRDGLSVPVRDRKETWELNTP